jgi:hypothetical protein
MTYQYQRDAHKHGVDPAEFLAMIKFQEAKGLAPDEAYQRALAVVIATQTPGRTPYAAYKVLFAALALLLAVIVALLR